LQESYQPPNITTDAIDQLINTFKLQAKKDKDTATAQRVLKERAQAEKVCTKTKDQSPSMVPTAKPTTTTVTTSMSFPPLEVEYPDLDKGMLRGTPMISQDEMGNSSSPAANTCLQQKVQTIMQDYLVHLMDTPGLPRLFTNQQAASRKYSLQFLCDFANAVLDDKTIDLLEYQHLLKHPKYKEVWCKLFGKEIWHLATTTKTIAFMEKQQTPQARCKVITYRQIICVYHSKKKDPYRTGIMIGGTLVNYPNNCGTPTADLLTVKLMFNSIISTPNAKFMTIDIKDFYLMTPMEHYKYFRMKLELFPQDIIN
jgi:hypothetical protein